MNHDEIIEKLHNFGNPRNVEGMARFGIRPKTKILGITVTDLRAMAKNIGADHRLAQKLWKSKIHEARILASMVDEAEKVTERQMDAWARQFDSWDVCDQVCANLFDKTGFARSKALEWSGSPGEFVKRAGFTLMACRAHRAKEAADEEFNGYLDIIKREAADGRNYVRKAVNWALRQIGKRSERMRKAALKTAREIERMDTLSARWIARDAIRELTSDKVRARIKE